MLVIFPSLYLIRLGDVLCQLSFKARQVITITSTHPVKHTNTLVKQYPAFPRHVELTSAAEGPIAIRSLAMHTDRIKSSQSPDIALIWPLPEITPSISSASTPPSPRPILLSVRPGSPASPELKRNRTSSCTSQHRPGSSQGRCQDPLYQHLLPLPTIPGPSSISLSQASVFQKIASEIPSLCAENEAPPTNASLMREETYYFPETLSQIEFVPSQPITFEAAFSQQMKEPRAGPSFPSSASSSKRLEQIALSDFSILSETGMVMGTTPTQASSRVGEVWTQKNDQRSQTRIRSSPSRSPAQTREAPASPSRPILAAKHLNSPSRPTTVPANSGLPTPPFTDARKSKPSRINRRDHDSTGDAKDDELEDELRDLKRCTSKYGILSPPSSSNTGGHSERDEAKTGFVDPFSAEFDEMEVEVDSDDDDRGVQRFQAGVPVTHARSKEARMDALGTSSWNIHAYEKITPLK
jgi:hypothetical protein